MDSQQIQGQEPWKIVTSSTGVSSGGEGFMVIFKPKKSTCRNPKVKEIAIIKGGLFFNRI